MAKRRSAIRQPATRRGWVSGVLLLACLTVGTQTAWAQYPSGPQITKDGTAVTLQDYASLPLSSLTTGTYPPPIDFTNQLGRANFLRSEPANAPQSSSRFFVNDLNANLYILDKATQTFTSYINFAQVFPKFVNEPGYSGGLVTFVFDPDYAQNGKFYTIHTEDPSISGSAVPINTYLPGLDLSGGYTTTAAVNPPAGSSVREAVLVEWTDTNISNATFEGTAREILRMGFNVVEHPMGDLLFNPLATSGQSDYGNLYIAVGDGGAGETAGATHPIPQGLDALQGKILRITPDIDLNPMDTLSANGRYRIPATGLDPNPFVLVSGAYGEIYAYGFRNPHRMTWDATSNILIVDDIGLNSWEEVDIVAEGANYGWAEREGTEQVFIGGNNNGLTGSQTNPPTPFPNPDTLTVAGISTPVTPIYPVAEYSHRDGNAISSGFVYRGALMPQLYGKYIFGDITTARLFYANLDDMIANNGVISNPLAPVHELQVVYNSPYNNQGPVNRRLYDIVADAYVNKGGIPSTSGVLPGGVVGVGQLDPYGIPYGGGRADIRIAMGGDGEIYILSKSDGFVRKLTAATVLMSIAVTPTTPSIVNGTSQQFTATGTYSDTSTQNLTASVTWNSGAPAVAAITTGGLASALTVGTSTITATLGAVNGSTTLAVTASAASPSIHVRAGTSSSYTDPTGNVWTGDVDYVGGTEGAVITHAIANTTTQPLYQTERYDAFTYTFTGLPAGSAYVVTLKFSENYWTAAGKRIFNVVLNGTTVLSNFDIFADAGGEYIADDKTFSTTVNSSGQIVIQFENGSADNAKIDAIELVPSESSTLPAPQITPSSETFTGSVSVSISDTNSTAAIYYTTDGSTPSPGVGTTRAYSASFNVTATTVVNAIAVLSGYGNSSMASATYTLGSAGTGAGIRVRAGTSSSYTDPTGNVWAGDVDYVGGTEAGVVTHAIANTTTQPLYQTERYDAFTYTFTGLPAGSAYVVTLKFSENYWTAAGKRIFNVILNGTTVLSNFDIFADAGGEYIADDKTFSTTVNSSGQIVIQFENGSADYAKIDAIQLIP